MYKFGPRDYNEKNFRKECTCCKKCDMIGSVWKKQDDPSYN